MLLLSCTENDNKTINNLSLGYEIEDTDSIQTDSLCLVEHIDSIELCYWYHNYNKAVAFTWDDNVPWHKYVAELFNRQGLKTTFYVNTQKFYRWQDRIKFPFNLSRYKNIAAEGHEIGTHTDVNKSYMLMSLEEAEHEMVLSSERVHDKFGYWPATMSHPTSHYNEAIDSLMALHYIDSRYSVRKDNDSAYSFLRIRTRYPLALYKASIDSFAVSSSRSYVYGGHSMDGKGYEPINSMTLDSLLSYIQIKYSKEFWISSFDNLAMYEFLRDNISYSLTNNCLQFDLTKVKDKIERYTHPQAIVTLKFAGVNLDFLSDGLVDYWYERGDSYVSVDLRKTDVLYFKKVLSESSKQHLQTISIE